MSIEPLAVTARDQSAPSKGSSQTAAGSGAESTVDNVNETEFLQLLVAQIQYQDPTNPTDSTAFVTQLAQFSSLEQLIGIHSDLDSLAQAGSPATNSQSGGK